MELGRTIYDEGWDLFAYTGYSPAMHAIIVAFKGTDSHSIYNWAENMHYFKTNYQVPYPGSEGASVHTGEASFPFFLQLAEQAFQKLSSFQGKLERDLVAVCTVPQSFHPVFLNVRSLAILSYIACRFIKIYATVQLLTPM